MEGSLSMNEEWLWRGLVEGLNEWGRIERRWWGEMKWFGRSVFKKELQKLRTVINIFYIKYLRDMKMWGGDRRGGDERWRRRRSRIELEIKYVGTHVTPFLKAASSGFFKRWTDFRQSQTHIKQYWRGWWKEMVIIDWAQDRDGESEEVVNEQKISNGVPVQCNTWTIIIFMRSNGENRSLRSL